MIGTRAGSTGPARLDISAWSGDDAFSHQSATVHLDDFHVTADDFAC
jgi:hypothetical protein